MYKPAVRLWVWKGPTFLVVHQLLELPWKSWSPGGCLNSHVTTFPSSTDSGQLCSQEFFWSGIFFNIAKSVVVSNSNTRAKPSQSRTGCSPQHSNGMQGLREGERLCGDKAQFDWGCFSQS